jgi:hypothetical protein
MLLITSVSLGSSSPLILGDGWRDELFSIPEVTAVRVRCLKCDEGFNAGLGSYMVLTYIYPYSYEATVVDLERKVLSRVEHRWYNDFTLTDDYVETAARTATIELARKVEATRGYLIYQSGRDKRVYDASIPGGIVDVT